MALDVNELRRLYGGFQAARVVITANNLGLFDRLARKPRGARELAGLLKADRRATEILLDALTGIGLLLKKDGKYRNAPLAETFLVAGKPQYQGDIIRHFDILWQNWSALDEVVRTGLPARRAFDHRSFIMGMNNIAALRVRDVLSAIGLAGVRTALDLGGGPGTYAIEMAKKGIDTTLFDRPETIGMARTLAKKEGVKGIRFMGGDFHTDDIGEGYDLILLSQILHAYSEEECRDLIARCREALSPGGRLAVQEFFLSEDRTSPPQGAMFAVNMLVGTVDGRAYSAGELRAWLRDAGFSGIKATQLEGNVIIEGQAPRRAQKGK